MSKPNKLSATMKSGNTVFSLKDMRDSNYSEHIHEMIQKIFQAKFGFAPENSMGKTFYGPDIVNSGTGMLKPNSNNNGYIFTTRPDLNLTYENIKIERKMAPLLTDEANSLMRAIRILLSPRLGKKIFKYDGLYPGPLECGIINPNYPFLAISDNIAKSLTGWPSGQLGVATTNAGLLKEVHVMADGPATFNGDFSLNLSCYSMKGNPVAYLYYYWILYIGFVYYQTHGLMPWPEYLINGRMDYTSRIYRVILDETRTFVTEMAATGYCFPRSVDIGPYFDFDREKPRPYAEMTTEIEFQCSGAIYMDEILIQQFNNTVSLYNPEFGKSSRTNYYKKVDRRFYKVFNNECLPRINPINRELEWWLPIPVWNANQDLVEIAQYSDY